MIKHYRDHAANQRTFLAWVRTAVAVMAFGFIVEKFDLFLLLITPAIPGRVISVPGQHFGNIVGLTLIVLGTVMIALSAVRFLTTYKNIENEKHVKDLSPHFDLALAVILVFIGTGLFFYLSEMI